MKGEKNMETNKILKKIYEELKDKIEKNNNQIFLKEYTIPSINYNYKSEDTKDLFFASGIEMEIERMMILFENKIYYSNYEDKYFFSNNEETVKKKMLTEIEKKTTQKTKMKQQLSEKIDNEYKELVEDLKQCTPEVILERAYEKVSKEEMTYKIKDKEYSIIELKALLKRKNILAECYDEWLESDGNFNEVLEYAIDTRIELIVADYKEEKSKNRKESR